MQQGTGGLNEVSSFFSTRWGSCNQRVHQGLQLWIMGKMKFYSLPPPHVRSEVMRKGEPGGFLANASPFTRRGRIAPAASLHAPSPNSPSCFEHTLTHYFTASSNGAQLPLNEVAASAVGAWPSCLFQLASKNSNLARCRCSLLRN